MEGMWFMGLFSKLFSKNDKIQESVKVNVEVKTEIEKCQPDIPELQGDYAKTIFLWAHDKATPIKKNDEYARYFLYECGIRDVTSYHKKLISEEYFTEASIESRLASLKVNELKEILTDLGQSVSGKKEVLIKRINESTDVTTITKYIPVVLYELSDKGKKFVEENNDYVLIHKHKNWGIDWKQYDQLHKPGYSFYDTMWGVFNKRIAKDTQHFGRNEYLNMYQLLREEGKRLPALEMLLRVLYIDLSGVEGKSIYELYKKGIYTKKEAMEYFNVAIMLAPGIIHPIYEYKDIYVDSLVDKLYEQKLPVQICEKTLFLEIVHSVLNETYDEKTTETILRKEYKKLIDKI